MWPRTRRWSKSAISSARRGWLVIAPSLNAVFIPHTHTWTLERQEIRPGKGRLLMLDRFADLREHF